MNTFSLNDFKILKQLSPENKRKFNNVYLCINKNNGLKYVLKHIVKNEKNKHHFKKLLFESSLKFKSENLPNFEFVYQDEKELFCFKKYVEGTQLNVFVKSIDDKLEFTYLFLEKLSILFEELCEMKIIHSDLKPSNILISKTEKDFDVFIIDFGLSFFPDKNDRELVYSLAYSPPELVLNRLIFATHSTDIYSLGICLFQIFEETLPFLNSHPGTITHLQISTDLEFSKKTPLFLQKIISKMCFKSKFLKPPSQMSNEMIDEIVIKGIDGRYKSLTEVLKDFVLNRNNKKSFFRRLF